MKTWIKNIIFGIFGYLVALFVGHIGSFDLVVSSVSEIFKIIVYYLYLPMLFFTLTAAVSSLKKRKGLGTPIVLWSLLWNLMLALILSLFSAFAYFLFTPSFVPSLKASTEMTQVISFSKPVYIIPAIIILAIIIGRATTPDESRYYPAYAFCNSWSEVFYRVAEHLFSYSWLAVFFFSGFFFKSFIEVGMFSTYVNFTIFLLIIVVFASFVIIPLLIAAFTGFKKDPFKPVIRLLGSAITALFANDPLYSYPQLYYETRRNLGVPKKVVSATMPLSNFISKGGTAMLSTLVCAIFAAQAGIEMNWANLSMLSSLCTLLSFVCGLHVKNEMLFICITTFTITNFSVDKNLQIQLLYSLPLITGFGYFIDTILSGLTAFIAGERTKSNYCIKRELLK